MAADLKKTIEILFQGKDKISPTINSIGNKLGTLGGGLSDISEPFTKATEKVAMLEAAIAAVAIAGLKMSSDLDTQAKKMQASLGLPTEEAQRFETIAKDVYTAGWGDDLAGAFEAVTLAQKKLGDNAGTDIGKVAEHALSLQQTFGTDINHSLGAVNSLMTNFGLTSEQAFNFIAAGFQQGLDGSGDFLQSITEYSTQFANGGADAGQFFSVMKTGFQDGILGTDRAADMFKEFRVRIQDGSKTTKESLESIGIDTAAFEANMASGKMSAMDAFKVILEKLNNTQDESVKLNAGVGLMGTQFEDMGTKAALAVDVTNTKMEDLDGKIDSIDISGFGKQFESLMRTITTEFGDLKQWDDVKDKLGQVFGDIADSFGDALENVDFSGLEGAVGELWDSVADIFRDNDFDLTTVEGMQNAVQAVIDTVESLTHVSEGVVNALSPLFTAFKSLLDLFNSLPDEVQVAIGAILGIGTALGTLGSALATGGSLMTGLASLKGFFSAGGGLARGVTAILGMLTGPVGFTVALAAAGAAVYSFSTSKLNAEIEESEKKIKSTNAEIARIDGLIKGIKNLPPGMNTIELQAAFDSKDWDRAEAILADLTGKAHTATLKAKAEDEKVVDFMKKINGLPPEKQVELTALYQAGEFDKLNAELAKIEKEKKVSIKADAKTAEANKKLKEAAKERTAEIKLKANLDMELTRIKGELEQNVEMIKAQAKTAQTAIEWKAKLDISEVEAAAKVTEAAFDSLGESVSAVSGSTSSMFGSLLENFEKLSNVEAGEFTRLVEKEQEARDKALRSQVELNEAQADYYNAKRSAMDRGDSLIQIDSSGLEPALEMVMWQILEKVQVRANASASEFLLGV